MGCGGTREVFWQRRSIPTTHMGVFGWGYRASGDLVDGEGFQEEECLEED